MTREELNSLITELNELSTFWELKKDRMKEIAHILVSYYMWWWNNAKDVEKKSAEDDLKNTV